ncbi:Dimethyl-sulfide monooxygenase [Cyphellophora attinorum]|uniref:Dimethyl-sulfide monooxygenase n=1 Tax=Cyphellophora attinorum TaxID=1664694 RepID=A0A0N0NM01_9EURO|nr:Dimethyl-sulfide monooxygenase [Phialophora attinorum]KPI39891.1 Dimethyl-sulfide monooxygenase [Phialophora attinorum]
MANDVEQKNGATADTATTKRRILLNGFDMFTVGHLSFGQWRAPGDRSATKRRDLTYWTDLARLLEKGDFNALFLADTYGQYDVYRGSAEPCIRTAAQFPMGDPAVPITAMAAVTKNLGFAITTSTSYEAPYTVAKRFSTLDHLTQGRFGWNIVTSFKESGSKALGTTPIEHDKRYEVAEEFLTVLYKLWEGSWADDALREDREHEIYADPSRIRTVQHDGEHYKVEAPHILDPSPQRTPFLFQAGTSPAGIAFGAKHSEGIFVSALSPHILAPRVAKLRAAAASAGRDPRALKVFAVITPIIGRTEQEAKDKYDEARKYTSYEAGLTFWSGNAGIDLSKFDLDTEISAFDVGTDHRVQSLVASLSYHGSDLPRGRHETSASRFPWVAMDQCR